MSNKIRDPLAIRSRFLGGLLAALVYGFLLLPIVIVVPMAFGTSNSLAFPPAQWSLDLFRTFFASPDWTGPLLQSLRIAAITTAVVLATGVPAAYGIVRLQFPGKSMITGLMTSSLVVPTVVTSLGLYIYFAFLRISGSNLALVIGHVIYTTPFVLLMIGAGIQKLDRNLEFGAQLMGAGWARMFVTVVLPQIVPSLVGAALFAFLISFDEVVISWFLSGPRTTTLPVRMYSAIQWEISPVIAAVSTLLTALSIVVCLISVVFAKSTPADR